MGRDGKTGGLGGMRAIKRWLCKINCTGGIMGALVVQLGV